MWKKTKALLLSLASVFVFMTCSSITNLNVGKDEDIPNTNIIRPVSSLVMTTMCEPIEAIDINDILIDEYTWNDIKLIALVTIAEAEGECEQGQRFVIDTILNRADSKHFPDTIYDVVYQPNHFSVVWNGRMDRCEVTEEMCQLVIEEMVSRTNHDVIFFNAGRYSKFGIPMFQIGNHYFSSHD